LFVAGPLTGLTGTGRFYIGIQTQRLQDKRPTKNQSLNVVRAYRGIHG